MSISLSLRAVATDRRRVDLALPWAGVDTVVSVLHLIGAPPCLASLPSPPPQGSRTLLLPWLHPMQRRWPDFWPASQTASRWPRGFSRRSFSSASRSSSGCTNGNESESGRTAKQVFPRRRGFFISLSAKRRPTSRSPSLVHFTPVSSRYFIKRFFGTPQTQRSDSASKFVRGSMNPHSMHWPTFSSNFIRRAHEL